MDRITIVYHKLLHKDSDRKLVEQRFIDTFPVDIGNYECSFGNELYNFIERTGHKESIIMTKEDLLNYYIGYDTETYKRLSFILSRMGDREKVEITKEDWL